MLIQIQTFAKVFTHGGENCIKLVHAIARS